MKSLNTNRKDGAGIPYHNKFFTQKTIKHILSEGFEWKTSNDSYAKPRINEQGTGCYKMLAGHSYGDWPIYVYICVDGIEVDNDYECGGNSSTRFFSFENSFEETYDQMVDYVNRLKSYASKNGIVLY